MDKKEKIDLLEKLLWLLTEDGITDVIHFAAEIQKREENPDALKKRVITAREQVEMLGAIDALLEGFAQKGNCCAKLLQLRIRDDLKEWQTTMKRREEEWRKRCATIAPERENE